MKLPIRHEAHTLETISEDYFISKLPKEAVRELVNYYDINNVNKKSQLKSILSLTL